MLHDLFARQIALVTDEQLVDALDGISVNLLQPLLDVGKGVYKTDIRISTCEVPSEAAVL